MTRTFDKVDQAIEKTMSSFKKQAMITSFYGEP